jgi:hypothetical protein
MTPEQAINHPSKNVISRALGAEASVEADMKTSEVEDGSTFLLCTDGITRHIPDNELRELLMNGRTPDAICAEMKERCFQRGAEDNLTAVIVQVGEPKFDAPMVDDERTVDAQMKTLPNIPTPPESRLVPPSRIAFPGPSASQSSSAVRANPRDSKRGSPVLRFFVFLLFLGVAAGAFYGGMRYQRLLSPSTTAVAPTPGPIEERAAFEHRRAAVDADAKKWLAENVPAGSKPLESKDSEYLYLYGRAQMLQGNHPEARQAFNLAIGNLRHELTPRLPLEAEIKLADAADALRSKPKAPSQEAVLAEQKAARTLDDLLGLKTEAAPK